MDGSSLELIFLYKKKPFSESRSWEHPKSGAKSKDGSLEFLTFFKKVKK